jgi:hypothetical protein
MQTNTFTHSLKNSLVASLLISMLLLIGFFTLEPSVTSAIGDTFTIEQTIAGEIAFATLANDVVMDNPTLGGVTGGLSRGTSTLAITTNSPTGYSLTMAFSSTTAMHKNGDPAVTIPNYAPNTPGLPENFSVPVGEAGFGYSVVAPSAADVGALFKNSDGTTCNTGALNTYNVCWYNVSDATAAVTLVTASAPATAATTSILFQVGIGANPVPEVPTGVYTATATLTAINI